MTFFLLQALTPTLKPQCPNFSSFCKVENAWKSLLIARTRCEFLFKLCALTKDTLLLKNQDWHILQRSRCLEQTQKMCVSSLFSHWSILISTPSFRAAPPWTFYFKQSNRKNREKVQTHLFEKNKNRAGKTLFLEGL